MRYELIITGLPQQRLICSRLYIRKTNQHYRDNNAKIEKTGNLQELKTTGKSK